MMQLGRPAFEITEEVCERVKSLASQGLTLVQMASSLGIHRDTLNEKKKDFSDFSDAIAQGRALSIEVATSSLFDLVKEKDLPSIKYFLNNIDPTNWKDRQTTESTIKTDIILREGMTEAEQEKAMDKETEANNRAIDAYIKG